MQNTIKLAAVGDIALSCSLKDRFKYNPLISSDVLPLLLESDIRLANFEFPFTRDLNPYHEYARESIRGCIELLDAIYPDVWTVFTMANNHVMDWGEEGLRTTRDILHERGVATVGVGYSISEAEEPFRIERGGVKIAIVSAGKPFCAASEEKPGINPIRSNVLEKQIRQLKCDGIDHVVLSIHWGVEYSQYPSPADRQLAHAMIDSGASLVIGHHPHTLQGVEKYKSGIVAYSLGNFIMDINIDLPPNETSLSEAHDTAVLIVEFTKHGIVYWNIAPLVINADMEVVKPTESKRKEIQNKIVRLSEGISRASFYTNAFGNLQGRTMRAWESKFNEMGLKAFLLLLRTLKLRHIRMIAMHYYYKISDVVGKAFGQK